MLPNGCSAVTKKMTRPRCVGELPDALAKAWSSRKREAIAVIAAVPEPAASTSSGEKVAPSARVAMPTPTRWPGFQRGGTSWPTPSITPKNVGQAIGRIRRIWQRHIGVSGRRAMGVDIKI
jgi:hypothetical protein